MPAMHLRSACTAVPPPPLHCALPRTLPHAAHPFACWHRLTPLLHRNIVTRSHNIVTARTPA
eukprot:scaffold63803_cov58-Phaeocystis_antarctica.AAC.1